MGPILVRIIAAMSPVDYRGEPWWLVRAQVANGVPDDHGGWVERDIYLRAIVVAGR